MTTSSTAGPPGALLTPDIAAFLLPVPGTSPSFPARVLSFIDFSGDCWEWRGASKGGGYGTVNRGARGAGNIQAHRAMWEMLVGAIPAGLTYDHLCRNHRCVNPDHGELVTAAVNRARGFSMSVLHARRTICRYGHSLDGMTGGRGSPRRHRYCKTCARKKAAKRDAARRKAA